MKLAITPNKPWKLEDGLRLVRALQEQTKDFGYHITLGGSVLNAGESENDLDLYFLPYTGMEANDTGLVEWLTSLWGRPTRPGDSGMKRIQYTPSVFSTASTGGPLANFVRVNGQWVVRQTAPTPPAYYVDESMPVSASFDEPEDEDEDEDEPEDEINVAPIQPTATPVQATGAYRHTLKFQRVGNDRIDVFIV